MRCRLLAMPFAVLILLSGAMVLPASAEISDPSAGQLAASLASGSNVITGAEYLEGPPSGNAVLVATNPIAGFPREGDSFAVLSTGAAVDVYAPNEQGDRSSDYGRTSTRSSAIYDVTVLKVDLTVPAAANCLLGVDFRFFSDEYPEYVGSSYNDAFLAEVDESTWTVSGNEISAPGNFAFDQQGNPITVNAAGAASMTADLAAGTTYDGGTDVLSAATPLTPGAHTLYFSIFDTGDGGYDSTVLIDNLRVGRVADVQTDCRPGAEAVHADTYLALGDSDSAGAGLSPYEAGTHEDNGNDCQRSTRAYSADVATSTELGRQFFACQGAQTRDLFRVRTERTNWGEEPQLDRLNASTGLVTYSIGAEDSGYAEILHDCVDGDEPLPFVTCYDNKQAYLAVNRAFAALDGAREEDGIHSYAEIFGRIRTNAEYAQVVQVGYPHLYPATGSAQTSPPGGRCEGVKKADQRWVVEKIDEINAIIEKQAGRAGYLYAYPSFDDHELCSDGTEWIHGILSAGGMHPNAAGHTAIATAVADALQQVNADGFVIEEGEHVSKTYVVKQSTELTTVAVRWPGSDVRTTLVSPSGERYDRDSAPAGHTVGPASEVFRITDPEPGTWTIEMLGADIDPDGERVTYSTYQEAAPNARPKARATVLRDGSKVSLDASSSHDKDGEIAAYDWYIETADGDQVLSGPKVTATLPENKPASVTLVVRDERGLTDFFTVNTPGIRWASASQPTISDPVTVALLSSPDLDTRTLSDMEWGPKDRPVNAADRTTRDVNGDGRADLLLEGTIGQLGLKVGAQTLCVAGELPDENLFRSCVPISLAAAAEPTPIPTDPTPTSPATSVPTASADPPSAGVETSRGSLAGSGGPNGLLLLGGALITAVAAGVLIAARRMRAR
jgi:hypothetical protein